MNKFKAIFFDMDGLLVDTESLYLDASREIFAPYGVELPLEWYIHEQLAKGTSTFSLLEQAGVPAPKVNELRLARDTRYVEMLEHIKPIDGVNEVLGKLSGKFTLAIVTSSHREAFDVIMEKTDLRKFFSFVITGDDVKNIKPDPEPYLKAVEISKQEKQYCLALEDSHKGSIAAKAAGISCYAIPDELTRTHDFSHADKVLSSIRELSPLLGV
jgi:HAD superfamily hydrolase (TIGR01509 family)